MKNMNEIKLLDLKSPILKIIFSFLNEKKKLNIIICNKKIQKKLEINIKNYEKISERYKIGERNGKGKEYNYFNDKLEFEGEYLNGKKNGKGKEYFSNGELYFEGEYLNGNKLRGMEYDINGILIYEGEYLNGKKVKNIIEI